MEWEGVGSAGVQFKAQGLQTAKAPRPVPKAKQPSRNPMPNYRNIEPQTQIREGWGTRVLGGRLWDYEW